MYSRKILFPTDFSDCSDAALEMATSVALDKHATLVIAHVEEPTTGYAGGDFYYPGPANHSVEGLLHEVVPMDASVPYEHRLISGDPATAIVQLADDVHAEMIVIGTHGRTGLTRFVMGSVAEAVVRRAPCPVMTVKQHSNVAATAH